MLFSFGTFFWIRMIIRWTSIYTVLLSLAFDHSAISFTLSTFHINTHKNQFKKNPANISGAKKLRCKSYLRSFGEL